VTIWLQAKNSFAKSIQPKRIIVYSLRNKNANKDPLYSVLNPDTNSDSASLKSKGARWVSPKNLMIQIGNKNQIKTLLLSLKFSIEYLLNLNIIKIINVFRTASYEMDCEILRKDPSKVYLELEAHPENKTTNTIKDDNIINKTNEKLVANNE